MRKSDFTSTNTGEVIDIGDRLCAFIPRPLPLPFACSDEALALIDDALLALGELRATIPYMPNPRLLTYPFSRREAVLSSKIEGTHTELEQLYLFETEEYSDAADVDRTDAREVHNYVMALDYGLDRLTSDTNCLPVCNRLLRELHAILFSGMPDDVVRAKHPGEYRHNQAFIGSRDITTARYIAPPAREIDRLMDNLERYIHAPAKSPRPCTLNEPPPALGGASLRWHGEG